MLQPCPPAPVPPWTTTRACALPGHPPRRDATVPRLVATHRARRGAGGRAGCALAGEAAAGAAAGDPVRNPASGRQRAHPVVAAGGRGVAGWVGNRHGRVRGGRVTALPAPARRDRRARDPAHRGCVGSSVLSGWPLDRVRHGRRAAQDQRDGATVVSLAPVLDPRGLAWLDDHTIVASRAAGSGLSFVPADGGALREITSPARERGERSHRWPAVVPGGKALLFTIGTSSNPDDYSQSQVDALVLATGERKKVLDKASFVRCTRGGRLLFLRTGVLYSVGFDASRLEVRGEPAAVLPGVEGDATTGAAHFSISADETLAYVPGLTASNQRRLVWADRHGTMTPIGLQPAVFNEPAVSPDGRRLAVIVGTSGRGDVWTYDTEREVYLETDLRESCGNAVLVVRRTGDLLLGHRFPGTTNDCPPQARGRNRRSDRARDRAGACVSRLHGSRGALCRGRGEHHRHQHPEGADFAALAARAARDVRRTALRADGLSGRAMAGVRLDVIGRAGGLPARDGRHRPMADLDGRRRWPSMVA